MRALTATLALVHAAPEKIPEPTMSAKEERMFTTRILAIVILLFGGLTFAQLNLAMAQSNEKMFNPQPEPPKWISIDEMMGVAPVPGESGHGVHLPSPPQQVEGNAARTDADPKAHPDADPNTLVLGSVVGDDIGGGKKSGYIYFPSVGSKDGGLWTMVPNPSSGSKSTFFSDPNAGRTSNPNAGRTSR